MIFVTAGAASQSQRPNLFFGGASLEVQPAATVDPAFPTGSRIAAQTRPKLPFRHCSERRAVCLHTDDATSANALSLLEEAYDAVVLGLGLPAPRPDTGGGSPALDLYLLSSDVPLEVWPELNAARSDALPAFCVAGRDTFEPSLAARCVAEASSFGLDAGETADLRRGFSSYASWLVNGPDRVSLEAVDAAQQSPQIGLLRRERGPLAEAGALWWAFLDEQFGVGAPFQLVTSVFALSRQSTPPGSIEWHNEPDTFDVLRASFGDEPVRFADVAVQFAISRLFLGDRADGMHPPNLAGLGSFGRVRFDWSLAFSSLPRNLASPRPLEPMGSCYLWLALDEVPLGAQLGVRFDWEAPVRFKWAVVSVDGQGREMRRWDVPYVETETRVERTLVHFEGAAGLVFVGINLGGVEKSYPFDPDHEPWEPHGYQVYVAVL